jgi:hypothetical protein
MISANKTFGDIEYSRLVGMQSILIRDDKVADIIALAGVV